MKQIVYALMILTIAVLACGCTTTTPSSQVVRATIPDLTGNWSGTMKGFIEEKGYTDYPGEAMTMRITEQRGRIFSGEIVFSAR